MATRVDVSFIDASNICCDVVVGLTIPKPPRRIGRANKSLSNVEHGGRPVIAGIRCC